MSLRATKPNSWQWWRNQTEQNKQPPGTRPQASPRRVPSVELVDRRTDPNGSYSLMSQAPIGHCCDGNRPYRQLFGQRGHTTANANKLRLKTLFKCFLAKQKYFQVIKAAALRQLLPWWTTLHLKTEIYMMCADQRSRLRARKKKVTLTLSEPNKSWSQVEQIEYALIFYYVSWAEPRKNRWVGCQPPPPPPKWIWGDVR